jgi:hypothetical protein
VKAAVAIALGLWLGAATPAWADDWEVRIDDHADVTAGAATTVSLTIAGNGGRVVSKDGPVRVALKSDTLKLPRLRYDRRQAADPAADAPRFDLKLTAPAAGEHTLAVDVRFWLCGKRACRPVHATRQVTITASP